MEKKYQLPKEFAEKWVAALRDKNNRDCTPNVIAKKVDSKSYNKFLLGNEMHWDLLYQWLNKGGGNTAADWIESNVKFI